jgi:rubrerythrin
VVSDKEKRKEQIYWGEELKRKYGIDIVNEQHDYDFYRRVAAKTRQPVNEIRRLFLDLRTIDEATFVPDDEMMRLVAKMNVVCKT